MRYVLKLLSGTLNGVEYTLADGDTIFHIGSHRSLVDGTVTDMLGNAENVFYLPEDLPEAAFVVRIHADEGATSLQLGERDDPGQAWRFRPSAMQAIESLAGVHFAVRHSHQSWSAQVLGFTPPPLLPVSQAAVAASGVISRSHRWRPAVSWSLAALSAAAVLSAIGFHWWDARDASTRDLVHLLQDAPASYRVVAGNDGSLYAFADDAQATAWGTRASRRVRRAHDVYLVRSAEAARLEAAMLAAGIEPVIVRLDDPSIPAIVVSGAVDPSRRKQIEHVLDGQVPYAKKLEIAGISDAALMAMAQEQMRLKGIRSRAEPAGDHVSVINDAALDDVRLHEMARMAQAFRRQWGQRRITIQIRLWDDPLQGRSYRYSTGQLLSVGDGRWEYTRSASSEFLQHGESS